MNKKLRLVIKIVLVVLLAAFGLCEVFLPTQTQQVVNIVWECLNQPLPLVGVSCVVVGGVIIKIVSMTTIGTGRINELKEVYEETKKESDKKVEEIKEENKKLEKEIAYYRETLIKLCESIKNVKVQEIGKELLKYGEEESNG